MNGYSDKLKSIDQRLKSKTLSRFERRELMEERKLEKYRLDRRKPISIKGVEVCNLVIGLMIIAACAVAQLTQGSVSKSSLNGGNIFFIFYFSVLLVLLVLYSLHKKEPADELCKELMYKATNFAAISAVVVLFAAGAAASLVGNYKYPEPMYFTYEEFSLMAFAMVGFFLSAKSTAYLWLDGTPASDDEEV